ncbi:RloB family protein [Kribbella sp. NPDC051718]|uniref:RloB family protein n=1 Tax=Kribbella sp. NPDC051718 TaxID=3155168 RepID=UPI003444BA80
MTFKKGSSGSRRPTNRRSFTRRVLVVCAARKTEKDYLEALALDVRNSAVKVKFKSDDGSPLDVVKLAAKLRHLDKEDFDEVWTVCDVDSFNVPKALIAGRQKGVKVAVSSPCFELYLLLHFEDVKRHIEDAEHAKAALRKYVVNYDKTKLDFDDFRDLVSVAHGRAKKLPECDELSVKNPSSGVWRLVELIYPAVSE